MIFFIFLYQKWIYPVDHSRINEFGTSGEIEEKLKQGISVDEINGEISGQNGHAIKEGEEQSEAEDKKNR